MFQEIPDLHKQKIERKWMGQNEISVIDFNLNNTDLFFFLLKEVS